MLRFLSSARYGMFVHFGMNTFADAELSDGRVPATTYNPSRIDAAQWVKTAKDAGMGCIVLVAKHHDGFCNWPASNTAYSVAASGNDTDVVRAVAKACAAQGIQLGLYYSLWDRYWDFLNGTGEYSNWVFSAQQNEDYLQYMLQHLRELLAYGPAAMLWLDGAWPKTPENWGLERLYDFVKRQQPDCQIGVNTTLNEANNGPFLPSDFRLQDPFLPAYPDNKLVAYGGQEYYLPWQTTFPMNRHWFWHASDTVLKTLDELEYDYYKATSQGNALLINSPPDTQGEMPQANVTQLEALRQRLGLAPGGTAAYPTNLSAMASASASNVRGDGAVFGAGQAVSEDIDARWATDDGVVACNLVQHFAGIQRVDHVVLREYESADIPGGFAVRGFVLEVLQGDSWVPVASGEAIGRSLRVDLGVQTAALRITILDAAGPPSLYAFWAFART
jgi:alpha-L-fucosidase